MKKTICIFSALYDPHIGGVENYTKELTRTLIEMGFRVIIVTNNHAGLLSKEDVAPDLRIYRLPCWSLLNDRLPLPRHNTEFRELIEELAQEPIDAMCINTRFYPHSLEGAKLARKKRIRPVVIDHGSDYLTLGNAAIDLVLKRYEHYMTDRLKRFDPDFYAVSKKGSQWLETFDITSKGEINNAIDVDEFLSRSSERDFREEFSIGKDAILVAFVGRLAPEKGISQLVEAARTIPSDVSLHVLIAGDGTLKESLEASAPSNVHLLGATTQSDVISLLKTADIFCLPSRSEGFATVLLEAAACKAAPVITHVGGVDELVPDEDHGVILPSTKPSEIASSLLALAQDQERREQIAENINERVKNKYNWHNTAEALLQAFEKANDEQNRS